MSVGTKSAHGGQGRNVHGECIQLVNNYDPLANLLAFNLSVFTGRSRPWRPKFDPSIKMKHFCTEMWI